MEPSASTWIPKPCLKLPSHLIAAKPCGTVMMDGFNMVQWGGLFNQTLGEPTCPCSEQIGGLQCASCLPQSTTREDRMIISSAFLAGCSLTLCSSSQPSPLLKHIGSWYGETVQDLDSTSVRSFVGRAWPLPFNPRWRTGSWRIYIYIYFTIYNYILNRHK